MTLPTIAALAADLAAGRTTSRALVEQALAHPQIAARNMLVSVPDGNGGTLKLAGNPLKMSAFADATTRPPAPDLDSDRARIVKWLDGA